MNFRDDVLFPMQDQVKAREHPAGDGQHAPTPGRFPPTAAQTGNSRQPPTVTFPPRRRLYLLEMARGQLPLEAREDSPGDRPLIEAAQRDPRRFAELYELNFDRVYAFIARRVRNREEAEDLTSEVFHQALANLPRFEWRGVPFLAWLLRMAANAIVDRWHATSKEQVDPRLDAEDKAALAEVEQRASLFQLVASLPPDQRRVILDRFVEQRTTREIAAALGRSEGAVKQLQFRAIENLRARIGGAHA
jgi:RNA polymerase sigma-70 factor (ECF subfamily)